MRIHYLQHVPFEGLGSMQPALLASGHTITVSRVGLLHNLDPVEAVSFKGEGGVPLMRNGDVVKRPVDPAELTERYTDEAIDFIEKNREAPFFLYLPHTMSHNPLGVSE